MHHWKHISASGILLLGLFLLAAGCHNDPQGCNNITPGAIPQPSGTNLCQWNHAQTARADRENFVIYQYEWSADPAQLTVNGREHVESLAARMAQSACPIVIETSNDAQLDANRCAAVVNQLAAKGGLAAASRVVVGRSDAEGLYGPEAIGVSARMLGNGVTGSVGNGASSSSGGGASNSSSGVSNTSSSSGGLTTGGGVY